MCLANLDVVADPERPIASPTENICIMMLMFADIASKSAFYTSMVPDYHSIETLQSLIFCARFLGGSILLTALSCVLFLD